MKVADVTTPIDFEGHIINAEIKPNGNIVGGHSTITGQVEIIPGTETAPNAVGVYEAEIRVADPNNPGQYLTEATNNGKSTMFPKDWTVDRIRVEVDAAFKNKSTFTNPANGKLMWKGTTPSGVKVTGYLNPKVTVMPKL